MFEDVSNLIIPLGDDGPNSHADLRALEAKVGPIPAAYETILRSTGAFMFDGFANVCGIPPEDIPLAGCYGAIGRHGIPSLQERGFDWEAHRLVPFARSDFGDVFAWSQEDGRIWLMLLENHAELIQVLNSMQEFLDSITVEEDD